MRARSSRVMARRAMIKIPYTATATRMAQITARPLPVRLQAHDLLGGLIQLTQLPGSHQHLGQQTVHRPGPQTHQGGGRRLLGEHLEIRGPPGDHPGDDHQVQHHAQGKAQDIAHRGPHRSPMLGTTTTW